MLDMLKSLLNEIKNNSLFVMFSHKNITIAGIIAIAVYLKRIGHHQINLSIQDSITILLVSYISGVFYITIWTEMTSLGWAIIFLANKVGIFNKIKKNIDPNDFKEIDTPDQLEVFIRIILAFLLSLLILSSLEWWNAIPALALPALIYALLMLFLYFIRSRKTNQETKSPTEDTSLIRAVTPILLLVPLFATDIFNFVNTGEVVDKTMEIASIRIKNKDIYIKAPYGELFSANSRNTTPVGDNFIILKNATILLNDIGGETLISYGDAKTAKRLSIPSAYVSIGEIYDLNKEPSPPREPSAVGSQK